MMTRRDAIVLADITRTVRLNGGAIGWEALADRLFTALKASNPRMDRDRFMSHITQEAQP